MIRRNKNIKGINLRGQETLLSLFADDTTMYLDGSERSFTEAILTLDHFSRMSGLRVNNDKTQLIWLGSRKNCGIRYMKDKNFQWDPGIFKILGVTFSTKTDDICNLNYSNKLDEIKRIIAKWKKREISPLGKVTVIKTLVIPKLTFLFINIPDPSLKFLKDLDSILFEFLWGHNTHKIKKKVVCQSYENGGIKMCNVFSFISSMKISWLRRLISKSSFAQLTTHLYPSLKSISSLGKEYAKATLSNLHNPFWKDVLKHYLKLCNGYLPKSSQDFMDEYIHYNSNIKRGNKSIIEKEWIEAGIFQVKDLVNNNYNFLTFEEFQATYPDINRTNFLKYEGIIQAIKSYQIKLGIALNASVNNPGNGVWGCIIKGNHAVKQLLEDNTDPPTAVIKWNTLFDELNWEKIFNKHFKTTIDSQLRWFQIRLLHRILPTGRYLSLCKLTDSSVCKFCSRDTETISHLFWHCNIVNGFWTHLLSVLKAKTTTCERLTFDEKLILFGITPNTKTDKPLDLIILLGKFFVYKCKFQNVLPSVQTFLPYLKYRHKVEQMVSFSNGKHDVFARQWVPYMAIFE